ncbi:PAS domain S-box protein [Natranaerofaba carboxydovora]|uniref:PAS domain S-box protein n=1 Tax=Natranaerofaba carboxydovora TaxID=2742683 RepID=UPI001F129866|nr:PAS domain S-box protein [Natranaerofaba carboxydovora]UMZ74443.1 putative diguanylate cyclase YegE [Natranaerofaba carboxydovora]
MSGEQINNNLKKFKAYIDEAPIGVFVVDREGNYIEVNKEACNMTGYSREELLNLTIKDVTAPETFAEGMEHFNELVETGRSERTFMAKRKDGSLFWEYMLAVKIDDSQYIGFARDITKQIQFEREINYQKTLFNGAIEAFKHSFLLIDIKDYSILLANKASGIKNKESITCHELTHDSEVPCSGDEHPCPVEIIKKTKEPTRVEHIHYDSKGRERLVEVLAYPVFNDDGELIQVIETVFDVTERKKAEKSLTMFRNALDSSGDSIFLISHPSLKILDVNETASYELGYGKEELLNLTPFDIKPYMSESELKKEFDEVINNIKNSNAAGKLKHGRSFETYHQRKDGSEFPVEVSIHLSETKTQESEYLFVASVRNITNRKEADKKLSEYIVETELKNMEIEELYNMLDEEVNKAKHIHKRMLLGDYSEVDSPKEVTLESHFYPAQSLGGDFYNFIKTDNNKFIIYLSDVSGHGLDGTIISVFVKETIESYVTLKPDDICPDKIMHHINRQYRKHNYPDDYFVCVFLAVLDLEKYELSYSSGGMQFSPMAKLGDGKKITLKSQGLPISSAIPKELISFSNEVITLTPGSTILFNTDGISEQVNSDGEAYEKKLNDVFYNYCDYPPELLKNAINKDFMEFNDGSLQGEDDITYVIMQIEPKDRKYYYWEINSSPQGIAEYNSVIFPRIQAYAKNSACFQGLLELVINAIEHGNKFHPDKKVHIEVIIADKYIYASVADEGDGFDWTEKIYCKKELNCEGERGRGIKMTRIMCEGLFYNTKGNKAYLILERYR